MNTFKQTYTIKSLDMDNAGLVSSCIKKQLRNRNIDPTIIRRIAIATYEAEINVVIHSHGGTVDIFVSDELVDIVFKDLGPGIECINTALQEGYSTASDYAREHGFGAGMGLPNIRNVTDEFYISSSNEGTILNLKFYLDLYANF